MDLIQEARNIFDLEIAALQQTSQALGPRFEKAVELLETTHKRGGKLLFLGLGKNVFIAQKIAATFNSTGVPSLFLDPVSALHGDIGISQAGDLAFLFSNSGQTEELLNALPSLKRLGVITMAITKDLTSDLAKGCDYALNYEVPSEACPLNLAPTASTTSALALGDALSMVFLKKRGFREEDFAMYHPSGTLGKSLLLRVNDVMRPVVSMAIVQRDATIADSLNAMTQKKCGLAAVLDQSGKLIGAFTDGDFRRVALAVENPLKERIDAHMSKTPKTIQGNMMAVEAVRRLEEMRVDDLIVVDEHGFPMGLIDSQDLPKLKLV